MRGIFSVYNLPLVSILFLPFLSGFSEAGSFLRRELRMAFKYTNVDTKGTIKVLLKKENENLLSVHW